MSAPHAETILVAAYDADDERRRLLDLGGGYAAAADLGEAVTLLLDAARHLPGHGADGAPASRPQWLERFAWSDDADAWQPNR